MGCRDQSGGDLTSRSSRTRQLSLACLLNLGVRPVSDARSEFDHQGFLVVGDVLSSEECDAAVLAVEALDATRPGSRRLLKDAAVRSIATRLKQSSVLADLLPEDAVCVQCTLFSKNGASSWSVSPHQDLSIPVRERVESTVLASWREKDGLLFTQPPAHVLQQLVAIRIQLDSASEQTGPLEVVPGSHRLGKLPASDAASAGAKRTSCTPPRGGAVVMRPLVVHSSGKSDSTLSRRVLHFLYGPSTLPYGLSWADAV